jgi:hypothetical protein
MRRIYFLVPNLDVTRKIVDDLRSERVEDRNIHVLARRDTPLDDLPEASVLEKTDFLPALEQGVALGGATGLLAGLVAVALPTGLVVGGGAVLGVALAGAGIGGWLSGMVGMNVGNRRVAQFQDEIERGKVMVMVDVPRDRVGEFEAIVRKHHPEAECEGVDPHVFP